MMFHITLSDALFFEDFITYLTNGIHYPFTMVAVMTDSLTLDKEKRKVQLLIGKLLISYEFLGWIFPRNALGCTTVD